MPRLVRHAVPASLPVLLAIALVAIRPGASAGAGGPAAQPLAAVDWPPSGGLVVGEVMTGGASASDELVELYNAGLTSVDLAGQEVVYVTSTGGTVTRKATWATTTMLDPGRHLLLANTSGVFAPIADATYSGGLAANGGTILVRPVGGAVIDAIGWGDASNAFVEGTAAPAPAAGSSLERRPGGSAGNRTDSNQNLADWLLNATPVAQNLASPAVPGGALPTPTTAPTPTPAPTPTATPVPTPKPSPSPTAVPTPSATPLPSPSPTAPPTPTPSPLPTPSSTPVATPTAAPTTTPTPAPTQTPTPSPLPTPTPTPTPTESSMPIPTPTATVSSTPSPAPTATPTPPASPSPGVSPSPGTIDIAVARTGAAGSRVRVRGIVTVEPGRIVDDRTFAIQDGTAGILVRLDGGRKDLMIARGTDVIVEGRLGARYGALELRLEAGDPLDAVGSGALPAAQAIELAALSEATEGKLVTATGVVVDIDTAKSGTTTIIVEDASGRGRVVAFARAGTIPDSIRRKVTLSVSGIGGQRSTATGRTDGYRIWVRAGGDLQVAATPSASPSPSASGSAAPSSGPSTPPNLVSVAVARAHVGQKVMIEGTITSQAGLLDADDRRVTIEDGTGAILLRLLAHESAPAVGSRVRATGSTSTYYGAPQLSATAQLSVIGRAAATPHVLSKAPGVGSEWELVRVRGTVVDVRRYGHAWRAELRLADGTKVPIVGLARAIIAVELIKEGQVGSIVGLVRRAYPSATDRRFAVLPRTKSDLDLGAVAATAGQASGGSKRTSAVGSSTGSAPSPSGPPSLDGSVTVDAAEVPANAGRLVRVGGLVMRPAAPVGQDAEVTVLIEDDSGTVSLRFLAAAATVGASLRAGDLVEATGTVESNSSGWVVVVDDAADVVTAGQVVDPQGSGASAPPGDRPDPTAGDAAASTAGEAGEDATADGAAPVTPLMGAAGAGGLVAAIVATAAAGGRWRRRRADEHESHHATERLVELLASTEGSPSDPTHGA